MLSFSVTLKAGESPYRQVVYAATKAIVSGELQPGDTFPSVREATTRQYFFGKPTIAASSGDS